VPYNARFAYTGYNDFALTIFQNLQHSGQPFGDFIPGSEQRTGLNVK
jgi:hypothetical protein